jgi:spore coat protein U-like protein
MVSLNRCGHSKAGLLMTCLGAGALPGAAHDAAAATATGSLIVSATVEATCAVSANPLSFGTYRPGQGNVTANTTLSVRCPKGSPFTVTLDAGTGGGTVVQRVMTFGAYRLQYSLYTTAARSTVWGDGTMSSATVAGIGHGLSSVQAIVETVYGQLPDISANQDLAPGLYTDTVRVTVSY